MMKKLIPYIIGLVIVFLLAWVISQAGRPVRNFDERVTLRPSDKIPYGTAAAKSLLPFLFKDAKIVTESLKPDVSRHLDEFDSRQALMIVTKNFYPDDDELSYLSRFVREGNYVFISAQNFYGNSEYFFDIAVLGSSLDGLFADAFGDSLSISLDSTIFGSPSKFVYPGKGASGWIQRYRSDVISVLGRYEDGKPNFIRIRQGNGAFFIHTTPLAFSNYFILHKSNVQYFQKVMSVLPDDLKSVVWSDYYLTNPVMSRQKEKGILSTLMEYKSFHAWFYAMLSLLILYVLMEMRRRQRMIPPHERPKNDSLDFVKTMGRLYYEKRDDRNLLIKMSVYFLEHVRRTYKISSGELDQKFVEALHYKSGYPKGEIEAIVSFILYLKRGGTVSEKQLVHYHKKLESFYQNT